MDQDHVRDGGNVVEFRTLPTVEVEVSLNELTTGRTGSRGRRTPPYAR
ncbi:unnamed protein product, partial [Ectocarpus sp. 12 AP-2014]